MILDKQRPRWTGFTSGCSIPRRTMAKVLARALLPLREPRGGCLSSTVVLSMRPFPVPPARPLARNDDVGAQSLLCRVGSLQPSQEDGPVLVVPCHRADGTRPTPFYSILDSANQLSLPSLTLVPRTTLKSTLPAILFFSLFPFRSLCHLSAARPFANW